MPDGNENPAPPLNPALPPAAPSPTKRNFLDSSTGKSALLLIGSSVMLIVGLAAVIYASAHFSGDSALWFVGFILIALSGLSMTAAIFRALGYDPKAGEAFGLPSGSVRAILAIAIMVLLLIFGLPLVNWVNAPVALDTKSFAHAEVDCASADAEAKRYGDLHLIAVVDKSKCGMQVAVTAGAVAPSAKASINLYGNTRLAMPPEQREQTKQLLTAIVTLLTTIIGFYFGSSNALSLVKATKTEPQKPTDLSANGADKANPNASKPMDGTDDDLEDPDNSQDGCPSDEEPQPGETHTDDEDLPEAEGGVEPLPTNPASPSPPLASQAEQSIK